jgi:hypothetical protein
MSLLTSTDLKRWMRESNGDVDPTHTTTMPTHKSLSWESGPLTLLAITPSNPGGQEDHVRATSEKAVLWNCLIRALNSIYVQAPHIPITEYSNFVNYSLATYKCLLVVLDGKLERDGGKLSEWGNWLKSCKKGRNNFSKDICLGMMNDFLPTLKTYMTSTPTQSRKDGSGNELQDLDRTTQIPLFWTNHDGAFGKGDGLPEGLDGGSRAMRWWIGRKKAEWWKFSTSGFGGRAREVRFIDLPASR